MQPPLPLHRCRFFSPREELANSLTHGIGALLSIAGFAVLLFLAAMRGNGWHIASVTIYGSSLVLLYTSSTCYHGFRHPTLKGTFRIADHICIYFLIAGTYTPFTLTFLRGGWGWTLFGLVWGLALLGLIYKIFFIHRFKILSTIGYLAVGWVFIIAIKPALEMIPMGALLWLTAGGLLYTGGVYFYLRDRVPYFHTVWHLFVLGGSACHYVAIMKYVLPAPV